MALAFAYGGGQLLADRYCASWPVVAESPCALGGRNGPGWRSSNHTDEAVDSAEYGSLNYCENVIGKTSRRTGNMGARPFIGRCLMASGL